MSDKIEFTQMPVELNVRVRMMVDVNLETKEMVAGIFDDCTHVVAELKGDLAQVPVIHVILGTIAAEALKELTVKLIDRDNPDALGAELMAIQQVLPLVKRLKTFIQKQAVFRYITEV